MAGLINSIQGRLVLMLFLIQAILMPFLYYVIYAAVEQTTTDQFLDDVRSYAQNFAIRFAESGAQMDDQDIVEVLDSAVLGGRSNYAAMQLGERLITSSLMIPEEAARFREDFEFGMHDDATYFLSLPIVTLPEMAVLRLGFDEAGVNENLVAARTTIVVIIVAYLLLSVLATAFLTSSIVRPLKRLQRASRSISSGEVERELRASSRIVEIRDLAEDLETMREELVGMNERLQSEMRERGVAEAERRGMENYLRQAQRLESLGTLAGGVAHEFNNVLQPILLYTDLALQTIPREQPASLNLRRVMDLARRAKGLAAQILTFGRYDEEMELELTDLREVVHEAVTMIRALYPATVDLRVNVGTHIGLVNGDPAQIKQLVVNLSNNAFQALSEPRDRIEISLNEVIVSEASATGTAKLQPGEYAVLEVADTGEGMSRETLERVFEPFFTTRGVGDGTGLGLSVVHGIVKRHDGEIVVESTPGEGTRVRIYLPLADEISGEFDLRELRDEQNTGN